MTEPEQTPVPYLSTITLNPEDHLMVVYLRETEQGLWEWVFRASPLLTNSPPAFRTVIAHLVQEAQLYAQTIPAEEAA